MKLQSVILGTGFFLIIGFHLMGCNSSTAQITPAKTYQERSQEILDFLLTGQADSITVRVNDNILSQMSPDVFIDAIQQYQDIFGEIEPWGEWEEFTYSEATIYYKYLLFGEQVVRIVTAFDNDGKANSLQLIPVSTEEM